MGRKTHAPRYVPAPPWTLRLRVELEAASRPRTSGKILKPTNKTSPDLLFKASLWNDQLLILIDLTF